MLSRYSVFNDHSVSTLSEMQKRKAYPPSCILEKYRYAQSACTEVHVPLRTYIILSPLNKGKIT